MAVSDQHGGHDCPFHDRIEDEIGKRSPNSVFFAMFSGLGLLIVIGVGVLLGVQSKVYDTLASLDRCLATFQVSMASMSTKNEERDRLLNRHDAEINSVIKEFSKHESSLLHVRDYEKRQK